MNIDRNDWLYLVGCCLTCDPEISWNKQMTVKHGPLKVQHTNGVFDVARVNASLCASKCIAHCHGQQERSARRHVELKKIIPKLSVMFIPCL